MACNFRAAMPRHLIPLVTALTLALALPAAQAEKADRLKPFVFTQDKLGRVDAVNQRTELLGNVVVTKGSLLLKAEKVDFQETKDGYHQAFATGVPGQPVTFRQARDIPGESIDGVANQLEYDTRTETVRFVGNATVRRLRGAAVAEEVSGAVIVYNSRTEVFTLEAGSASPNPNGRTRIVMMPRVQPGDEAASAPAAPLPLKPSTTLQPGKPS
ncbi:MAG: lipopolysaccharide transport periplasmic protein LptA [Burkholderiales bacterium]|nr:MAG: lipopolysaccharide transport periplasmic protein LptA [Burkholderiales bacterium]